MECGDTPAPLIFLSSITLDDEQEEGGPDWQQYVNMERGRSQLLMKTEPVWEVGDILGKRGREGRIKERWRFCELATDDCQLHGSKGQTLSSSSVSS